MTEVVHRIEVEAPYCISAWQYVRLVSVDVGIASCPPSAEEYQVVTDVALEGRDDMGCGLRLKAWTIEVISQSHLGSDGIQSHVGIGGVAIGEVGDRSSDVEVKPSCQDDVGIKVGIDISRHLGTDDVVGGIGVGVVRIPAEGETEVPLVVEGNSLAAKDACSLEEAEEESNLKAPIMLKDILLKKRMKR